ncbi:V-type ATP synthase subunit E family protein [Acholeplasma granularum]|uniref:V-type ATP synthase subunit E family protein n=1 Tax=Acholeplasma granularum TaxID=264635 RepID=UPI00046F8616|nr:V-type ATP synthase subunit E family protein [Acholeplasma granularum]
MSKFEEKILKKGEIIVESINKSAIEESNNLKEKLILNAKNELELQLKKEIEKAQDLIKQANQESVRNLRDEVAISKQNIINSIFNEVKTMLLNLKDEDYFNYVLKSILSETIQKNKVIQVSKKDYKLYQRILTTLNGHLVDADILNKKLGNGYNLKLSDTPADIESGFILVGPMFDLNFSLENLLEKLVNKYEKEIYEALN